MTGYTTNVDRDAKTVQMSNGATIPYDRLVVSPGIDLNCDSVPGYSQEGSQFAPHAWKVSA
ncbi:MAG: hypothetical protein ACTSSQ_05690 [Alphaproteobacteria bacterium]